MGPLRDQGAHAERDEVERPEREPSRAEQSQEERATGRNIGVVAQLHFYVDDMFPDTLGQPLFGGGR